MCIVLHPQIVQHAQRRSLLFNLRGEKHIFSCVPCDVQGAHKLFGLYPHFTLTPACLTGLCHPSADNIKPVELWM